MGSWLIDALIERILDWFAKTILGALNALWELLSATVFVSPDVTQLPQVTTFAATSLGIVNASYVLAFLWMGLLVLGRDTIQTTYGPGELIPRLIIGLIAANFAVPLCSTVIELANTFTSAVTSQGITAPDSMRQLRDTTTAALHNQTGAAPTSFLLLVIGLLIAVLVATLVVQWIIRLGVLVVAVGIAPIALALHGTPQTEGAAKLWWRTLLGTLGTVIMQAVALHTTLTIFLSPDANLPALGLPGDPGAVMNLLIVVCLLWGVVKIPGLMRRYVTQTRPSSMGTVFRVMVVQQLTRGISRAFTSGHGAARTIADSRVRGAGAKTDPPWPTTFGSGTRAAAVSVSGQPHRSAARTPHSLPRPAGAGPGRIGIAYPTGRVVRPYTRDELAGGVDLYTRAMKARATAGSTTTTKPRIARPTSRPITPYSREELAQGVDLYTRAMKARATANSRKANP